MKLKITKGEMWKATIDDQPGGAAAVLDPVARAGGNFEFAFARRAAEMPGKGLLFITPVKGKKVVAAAQSVGLGAAPDMHLLRIEGGDKPGTTAAITRALANAGISFRALSATAVGRNFKGFLVLDSAEDAARAGATLKKL
ncbi:MAG: ACT domain-containing protein [Burkholderiales bacterium]